MNKPEVEFFSEDVEGVEYLNVGFKFWVPGEAEPVRCVLGAFSGEVDQNAMRIIKGLVEEAAIYMQGVFSGDIAIADTSALEIVKSELVVPGGGASLDG